MKWKVKATNPPKPREKYTTIIAWVLAVIMIVFAVAHLFRIDTLIPIVEGVLSQGWAAAFVVVIVISEVFAVPYLLQMRLSPLARVMSGLLVVLVPLLWACLTVWGLGNPNSTGQFTSYVSTPASWWLVVLNLVWCAVSYWFLWLTNFNQAFVVVRKEIKS